MEAKRICDAAGDGKLDQLKSLLEKKCKDDVEMLMSSVTNGRTPLIMACLRGHSDVVEYLIKECHAQIDQRGGSLPGQSRMTPLWCAVSEGNFDLVKTLINLKASVNEHAGRDLGTPLFAACYRDLLDIVVYLVENGADIDITADEDGTTCLMRACKNEHRNVVQFLLDCKADVHKKDFQGNTALHYCAKSGNFHLIQKLVKYGAQLDFNASGFAPLLFAAVNCEMLAVSSLVQHFNVSKIQEIEALEVLGASDVLYAEHLMMGFFDWECAMKLRYKDREFPIEKPHSASTLSSLLNETEVLTPLQLDELRSPHRMRKQALLTIERIFGSYSFECNEFIVSYIERNSGNEHFNRHIHLWMHAFDNLQYPLDRMMFAENCFLYVRLLNRLIEVFFNIISNNQFSMISFGDILGLLQRIVRGMDNILQKSSIAMDPHILAQSVNFIGLICMFKPYLKKNEERELRQSVCELVRMKPRTDNGETLLHFACSQYASCLIENAELIFPSLVAVNLLLEANACPNAVDKNLNTPLHVAAMNRPLFSHAIFMSLLKHGGHLDICNNDRQTPLQLTEGRLLNLKPLCYIDLQCLSAQAIQTHKIAYKGFVDKTLENFIDIH